jgi:hypothetical protein
MIYTLTTESTKGTTTNHRDLNDKYFASLQMILLCVLCENLSARGG